jgi:site-specific DNA recombinase
MGREGDRFHSPDVQAGQVRVRLAALGIAEAMVVEDLDRSGRTMDRPGLARVLAAVDAGEVDCVAVHELSRLGRNTSETLALIDRLRARGVVIVSTAESVDDTPEGRLALTMWLGIAEHYSRQIGRRWEQLAARRATELGQLHGSKPPLGYRRVGALIEPDALAPAVAELFTGYAAGQPMHELARQFSAAREQATAVRVVKRMLANPVYVGLVHLHGVTYPGAHEAIVDEATWTRVQRRLATDRVIPARTLTSPSHALVGLVVCDRCGRRLRRVPVRGEAYVLRCGTQVESGGCLGSGTMVDTLAEAVVLAEVLAYAQWLRDSSAARAAARARKVEAKTDAARLRARVRQAEAALRNAAVDRAMRVMSEAAYVQAARGIEATLADLRLELAHAEVAAEVPAARGQASAALALVEAWPSMTVTERNVALKALVREVRVRAAGGRQRGALSPAQRITVVWK